MHALRVIGWGRTVLRMACLATLGLALAGCVVVPAYPVRWHPAPVYYYR